MKITTECVPCLLKRIVFEAEQSTKDEEVRTDAIRKACQALSDYYHPNKCSASVATKVHGVAYEALGDEDPYADLKNRSNKIAKTLLPMVKEKIAESDDSLRESMLCSIVGNLMDFGIAGASTDPEDLEEVFEEIYQQGLCYDDSSEVKKLLEDSDNVLLFVDNCGEVVFDKLLCEEIKKFNPDVFLTVVVKGTPVLSDATFEDAEDIGLTDVADETLTTGCFAVGVDFEGTPKVLQRRLDESDLIICKGMANYEAFSESDYKPIVYLLRTKCNPIASSMDLPQDINAIKMYK
ncbi:MAG: ARMT1-like domain-containing protein [Candidatus Thermoplasmatota archaeon]